MIRAQRVDSHPEPDGPFEVRHCGLCGAYIYVHPKTVIFLAMCPTVPLLCCSCGQLSLDLLHRLIPRLESIAAEVPDLARQGVFN